MMSGHRFKPEHAVKLLSSESYALMQPKEMIAQFGIMEGDRRRAV